MEVIKTENNIPVVRLPKKPKKILLCMLSHHNLPALKRMVKSVEQQYEEKNLIIEPIIVINTLNDQYYEDVLNEGFSYNVIRTETDTIQFEYPFPPHVESMKTKMREHVQEWRSSHEELPMVFKSLLLNWEQKAEVIKELYK